MKAESKTKLSPLRRPSSRHDSHYYSEASSARPIATSRSRGSMHPTERTPRRKSERSRMHQETEQFLRKYFGQREEVEEGQFIEAFSNEYSELWQHEPQICQDLLNLLGRTLFQSRYFDRQKLSSLSREGGMLGLVMDLLKQLDLDCDAPQIKNLKNVVQQYLESMYNKIQIRLQNHFNNEMRRTVLRLKQAQNLLRKVEDRIKASAHQLKAQSSGELREERRLGEALQQENDKLHRQNKKMSQTIEKFQAVIEKQKEKKERQADKTDRRVAFANTPLKQPPVKDRLETHCSRYQHTQNQTSAVNSQEPPARQNSYKVIQTNSKMHLLKTPIGRTQQQVSDHSAHRLPYQQYHARPFNQFQKESPLPSHMIATFDRPTSQPCNCPAGCLNDCVKKFIRGLLNEAEQQGLSCRVKVSQVGIR